MFTVPFTPTLVRLSLPQLFSVLLITDLGLGYSRSTVYNPDDYNIHRAKRSRKIPHQSSSQIPSSTHLSDHSLPSTVLARRETHHKQHQRIAPRPRCAIHAPSSALCTHHPRASPCPHLLPSRSSTASPFNTMSKSRSRGACAVSAGGMCLLWYSVEGTLFAVRVVIESMI